MTKLQALLTTRLRDLLAQTRGAPAEEQIRALVDETGASGSDLRRALDELASGYGIGVDKEGSWRRVIADYAFSMSNPTGVRGRRAHEVRGHEVARKQPWYAAVKADATTLGPLAFSTSPCDVEVQGERFTSTELTSILKSIGRR